MKNESSAIPEQVCGDLQVGYGRVDVTPDYPVGMAGGAAKRISEGALDPLYVTFIALRQGENTFLLATMDFVCSFEEYCESVTAAISQATGVPAAHIILNSTHTHSSVALRTADAVGIRQYRKDFCDRAVAAAQAALADLAAAEVRYGTADAKGMIWVRHYKLANGTYAGANYGSFKSSTITGHAWDADTQMQLIQFTRPAEGKKDIILMSYPSHATMNQKSILLSADFPGPAREYIARETGAEVAYFIGGGGDQVPGSRIEEERFSTDYRVYGEEVGRIAVAGLSGLKKLDTTQLRFARRTFTGKSNKTDMDRVDDALAVRDIWDQIGGRGTPEGKAAAKARGFSSVYAVTAILNRMNFDETRSMELKTLAIGELSFMFAPYELFGASAAQIKKDSPYGMTFVVSCSQNHAGYLPSKDGWQLRCYEAQITKFAPGTAEQLAEEYVDLLREMKNS